MKKLIFILVLFSSCSTSRNVKNISTPTRKEIKRAMKYSSSEYMMPRNSYIYNPSY